jgi:hypothetical protein
MSTQISGFCLGCSHFMHEPQILERALPGLSSLSSAYAAVRADDGLCSVHERYVAGSSSCTRYVAAAAA